MIDSNCAFKLFDRYKAQQVSNIFIPVIQEACSSTSLVQQLISQLPSVVIPPAARVVTGR